MFDSFLANGTASLLGDIYIRNIVCALAGGLMIKSAMLQRFTKNSTEQDDRPDLLRSPFLTTRRSRAIWAGQMLIRSTAVRVKPAEATDQT
jgi:hypothetical protein